MSLVVGVLVSGFISASTPIPQDVTRAFTQASLEDVDGDLTDAQIARAAQRGWNEEKLNQWLVSLLQDCLGQSEPCDDLEAMASGDRARMARTLIQTLGTWVTAKSAPLLWRLERHGSVDAARTLENLRSREMRAAIAHFPCAPPTAEETAEAWSTLADFWRLEVKEARVVATRPSSAEMDDLAYFYAASEGSHLFDVGKVEPAARSVGWLSPGPHDESREALAAQLRTAQDQGDIPGITDAARRYLTTLGYPGPLRIEQESSFVGGGARYSYVMRALAEADELTGDFREAAALFRRADPGGGRSGTAVEFRWQAQIRGLIASEERAGRCRAAVPERLLDIDGDEGPDAYGPTRLAKAGFDVPRLYRGALVTLHRDVELEQLAAALVEPEATARLGRQGPEAWEYRVRAIEGWAATQGRAAVPLLVGWAQSGPISTRVRALKALGSLVERPAWDPCKPAAAPAAARPASTDGNFWRRPIRPLATCDQTLDVRERDALATQLAPLLLQPDASLRTAAAQALGKIGSLRARAALKKVVAQRQPGQEVVAEAAKTALGNLARFSKPPRRSAMKGLARLRRILRTQ